MLLSRRGLLAIAAVVEMTLQKDGLPLSAKKLAARHGLPPRHLEQILQALVRDGILEGVRGPHGGSRLARDLNGVTARDILRAAEIEPGPGEQLNSAVVTEVVLPLLSAVEQQRGEALGRIPPRRCGESSRQQRQRPAALRTNRRASPLVWRYRADRRLFD
jgi:Rrf2 family protein